MIESNHIRRLVFAIINVGASFLITDWIAYNATVDKMLVFLLVSFAIMLGYGYGIFTMISKYGKQIKDAAEESKKR